MGAWGHGPFDNDSAADWCGDLDDAAPADRPGLVRAAFTSVLESDSYLESDEGSAVVAAAALVASHLPGGTPVTSPYAPDFLVEGGGRLEITPDLPPLALRALDRIVGDDSEWCELWSESGSLDPDVAASLEPIRAILQRADGR
ncbi:DUF4259 domain-containing protein [Actinoplanes solisilvae]|uniref:DUF4259 domain-containing protein n=1 Tax=Actinoplanes solisilvae TaxID=2486853 RepID=UPI000FDB8F28|nr:DUF4259 domain-containing protein [Actinoplanes solisilvae]